MWKNSGWAKTLDSPVGLTNYFLCLLLPTANFTPPTIVRSLSGGRYPPHWPLTAAGMSLTPGPVPVALLGPKYPR